MKSVICDVCGGDARISEDVSTWQCSYCGAIHVVEKPSKKKLKLEDESVGRQNISRSTPGRKPEETPDWGYKKEE